MPAKNPRIQVCLNPIDHEIIKSLAHEKKMSISSFVRKIVEKKLEKYEKNNKK